MFVKTARAGLVAAALALGGLTAPALAAPIGPDAGLTGGPDGIVAVQYGYGRHDGWGRHGHRHHWGRHHGPRWGHHHHHHRGHWGHHRGGWGHHHHRGRHHGHW